MAYVYTLPGTPVTLLPFVEAAQTRFYDFLLPVGPGHDPANDPGDQHVGEIFYDPGRPSNLQLNGDYPVYYSFVGEGRDVYIRVVGEIDPGVVLQVFRRNVDDAEHPYSEVAYAADGGSAVSFRRAAAVQFFALAGVTYSVRVASYGSRAAPVGTRGQPGYDSMTGQLLVTTIDYADLNKNDFRNDAHKVEIFAEAIPYVSVPVLNTTYTAFVSDIDDPFQNFLLRTAWWRYQPLEDGPWRATAAYLDQEGFPGTLFAYRMEGDGTLTYLDVTNSGKDYVSGTANKGDFIYFEVGVYNQFLTPAQFYQLTVTGAVSAEGLKLRLPSTHWELLSGGPYPGGNLFLSTFGGWARQVKAGTIGAQPLMLRDGDQWKTALYMMPGKVATETWVIVGDQSGSIRRQGGDHNAYTTRRQFASPAVGNANQWLIGGVDYNLGDDNQGTGSSYLLATTTVSRLASAATPYPAETIKTNYRRSVVHVDFAYIRSQSEATSATQARLIFRGEVSARLAFEGNRTRQIPGAAENSIPPWRFYIEDVTEYGPRTAQIGGVDQPYQVFLPEIEPDSLDVHPFYDYFKYTFDAQGARLGSVQNTSGYTVSLDTADTQVRQATPFEIAVQIPGFFFENGRDYAIYGDTISLTPPTLSGGSSVTFQISAQCSVYLELA